MYKKSRSYSVFILQLRYVDCNFLELLFEIFKKLLIYYHFLDNIDVSSNGMVV